MVIRPGFGSSACSSIYKSALENTLAMLSPGPQQSTSDNFMRQKNIRFKDVSYERTISAQQVSERVLATWAWTGK